MKKKYFLIVAALMIVAFGLGIYRFKSNQYSIVHPERSDINEAIYGLGKIKSKKKFDVVAGVMSTVTKRYFDEGDSVKKGAPLIQLNDQVIFKAPFDGTVTLANYSEGETVIPNVPVLRLEDLDQKFIELSLEQQSVLRLKVDQTARVSFESVRGKILNGKVVAIFPRKDEFIVSIEVTDLDRNILPGMTADVSIEVGLIKAAVTLPLAAIKNGMISLQRNGRWQNVKVDIGQIDGLTVEIKSPALDPSDSVRMKTGG